MNGPARLARHDMPWGSEVQEHLNHLVTAAMSRCHNPQIEAGVLGAMLANQAAYEAVRDTLTDAAFTDPHHAIVWALYEEQYYRGLTCDAVTLRPLLTARLMVEGIAGDDLRTTEEWTEAGKTLTGLLASMVPPALVKGYAETLAELWRRREAARHSLSLWRSVISDAAVDAGVAAAVEALDRLRGGMRHPGGPVRIVTAMETALKRAEEAAQRGGILGARTGFQRADRMLRGMVGGRVYILAGRPGMGKSALGQSIVRHSARDNDGDELIFSLEMDEELFGEREIAMGEDVDFDAMARGEADQRMWDRALASLLEHRDRGVWIDARPRLTIAEMKLATRRLQRTRRVKRVIVDHLHLVRPPEHLRRAGRMEQLEAITGEMVEWAKECDVPVLALAQLSREVEKREDKRPELADLRSSGSIEQDAHAVMFIYRPGYYAEKERPAPLPPDTPVDDPRYAEQARWRARWEREGSAAELIIAKNRGGKTGTVHLQWFADRTLFADYGEGE